MDKMNDAKNTVYARWFGVVVAVSLVALLVKGCDQWGVTVQAPKIELVKANKTIVASKIIELNGVNHKNQFTLNGSVPSSIIKVQIDAELKRVFGVDNYVNNLVIDEMVKSPDWLSKLPNLFDHFKLPGSEVSIFGDVMTLSGTAGSLEIRLQEFVGDSAKVNLLNTQAAAQLATKGALDALNALTSDSSSEEILRALGSQVINFASGSIEIPHHNQVVLAKAAALLKLKEGVEFEISGHADNQGSSLSNFALSTKRAQVVRQFLIEKGGLPDGMLTAKGYGDSLPISDNTTETGRLKNRRIVYTLH